MACPSCHCAVTQTVPDPSLWIVSAAALCASARAGRPASAASTMAPTATVRPRTSARTTGRGRTGRRASADQELVVGDVPVRVEVAVGTGCGVVVVVVVAVQPLIVLALVAHHS